MNKKFQIVFEKLEEERKKLLAELSSLSSEQFQQSTDGKWSISQILTHLLTSERLSILYMKKKSQGIDGYKNSGVLESLKFNLLKISQRIPSLKYKAPKALVDNTPEAMAYDQIVKMWDKSRMDLSKFLETIADKNVRKKIYKHPVVGMLDAAQGTTFMGEHVGHHVPQIRKILKTL